MLLLIFASRRKSGAVIPIPEPEKVRIDPLQGGCGGNDEELVNVFLIDDQDMQDLIMVFEAFRSIQHG